MWPFPLKFKSIPIDVLRTFLTTHGHPASPTKRIITDGEGSLAESQTCRNMVTKLGFTIQKTATDSTSQNGVAERPHQTLAVMVRCLLYSSLVLVLTFWADALVYAAYINNRLYHLGVQDIPDMATPTPRLLPQNQLSVYKQPPMSLLAYSDSDWGRDTTHRRSVSGTIILLSGAAVLYSTKFPLSITEAKFVSASDACKYALYLRSILTDLWYDQSDPTTLFIDNTGAVFMVEAHAPTRRT